MLRLASFLILFLAMLATSGCGGASQGTDSDSLLRAVYVSDDGIAVDYSGRQTAVTGAAHIGLTALEESGRVVPALAASWRVSDDGLSYIFKLREAYWTDGRRMTAGDVVAVMRRIISPGSGNPLKDQLMMVANAAAVAGNRKPARMLGVDDPRPDTVVITLMQPEPSLLLLLADPAAAIVRGGDSPASGPFTATEDDRAGGDFTLARNGSYYAADTVAIGGARLSQADVETAIRQFVAGKADIVTGGRIGGIRAARTAVDAAALNLEPSWGLYYYLARSSSGPLADIRIRRALAMSIDRAGILSRMFGIAGLQPAFSALPPTLPDAYAGSGADWAQWTPEARRAEAVRLLAEAGYTPERQLEISVAIPHGRDHADLLSAISAYWADIGVRVKAYARGPLSHRKAIESGDYDLALVEHIAPAPIAGTFLRPFTCDVRLGGYCNPAVDELLEQAATEDDPGTRIQLERRANRLITEDAPLIAVLSPVRWSLIAPRVAGWENNVAGAHPLAGLSIAGAKSQEK